MRAAQTAFATLATMTMYVRLVPEDTGRPHGPAPMPAPVFVGPATFDDGSVVL